MDGVGVMKAYRAFLIKFLIFCIALFFVIGCLNYIIDPLQFYRQAQLYKPRYSREQRYQNPGLARNYDYDTIIVGTSLTENFLASSLNRKWGVKAINLAMSGSTAREQYLITDLAIRTGRVANVLWGLDYASLRGNCLRVRDDQGPFPYYLYDDNDFNDVYYLLNRSTTGESMKIIKDRLLKKERTANLNLLHYWGNNYEYSREIVLEQWENINFPEDNRRGGDGGEYALNLLKANFDRNILSLVEDNPEVRFIFFYPPYSVLQHGYWYRYDAVKFYNELEIKRYIFEQLKGCDNAELHDFQSDKRLTFILDNYKDLAHYRPEYNEYIIEAIQEKKYMVTGDNVETLLSKLKHQVENLKI